MEAILDSNVITDTQGSRTARIAASLFFFLGVPMSLWGQAYVYRKIFIPLDPVATANNLLANEFMFRTSIVFHLIDTLLFVFIILLFYRLLRPVDKHLARLMLFPAFAQIALVMVMEVFSYTALMVLKSEARPTFGLAQQQEAAYFLLRIHGYGAGVGMGKFFIGLCFIPFGMLVIRSGFAPRIIGILLIIGGVGYLADCCTAIMLQRADYVMVRSFLMYTTLAYFFSLLWFLVRGVKQKVIR